MNLWEVQPVLHNCSSLWLWFNQIIRLGAEQHANSPQKLTAALRAVRQIRIGLVLSRCGFDLSAAASVALNPWPPDSSSQPFILCSPCFLFSFPPASVCQTSIFTLFWLWTLFCTFCLLHFFLSFPSWTLVFCSAGIRAGNAVSLLHLHLHISGKQIRAALGI